MYGQSLTVWDWQERKPIQTLELGPHGVMPLEIRFLHDPDARTGFVGCALTANVFRLLLVKRILFQLTVFTDAQVPPDGRRHLEGG